MSNYPRAIDGKLVNEIDHFLGLRLKGDISEDFDLTELGETFATSLTNETNYARHVYVASCKDYKKP
jgi:hypothetical protein